MMQSVSLARGVIEYRRIDATAAPAAARPTLVFLHEGLGCVALWRDFPDRVSAAVQMPALVYSRYGYGGSSPCDLPRPLTYMHDEAQQVLPELLRQLGIRDYVLIGHSDGASIALIHAGTRPEGLRGVVVLAPHSFCEEISVASIALADQAYKSGDLRARLQKHHGKNVDAAFRGWCDAWLDPDFMRWNIERYLPQISVPVLALQGEQDEYGTTKQLHRLAELMPERATTVFLPACGHSPQKDQPAATLGHIADFIDKNFHT